MLLEKKWNDWIYAWFNNSLNLFVPRMFLEIHYISNVFFHQILRIGIGDIFIVELMTVFCLSEIIAIGYKQVKWKFMGQHQFLQLDIMQKTKLNVIADSYL